MKKIYIMLILAIIIVSMLMACSSNNEELLIGKYVDEETVKFDKERIIDENTINIVMETFSSAQRSISKSKNTLPDLVININDTNNSTLVLMVSVWFNDDSTASYYRGTDPLDAKKTYLLSEEETEKIKRILLN